MTAPKKPAALGAEGSKLWREITSSLVLDVGDTSLLAAAAHTLDEIVMMEKALRAGEMWVDGAAGQKRLTPLLAQLSVHRGRLARLLQQLLPEHEAESASAGASRMAAARWNKRLGA